MAVTGNADSKATQQWLFLGPWRPSLHGTLMEVMFARRWKPLMITRVDVTVTQQGTDPQKETLQLA